MLLLGLALALIYLLGVHWWFTAPFLEAREDLIEARDQEAKFRHIAQQRSLIEQRLLEVREFEASNPEFLAEENFDLAASSLIQRLQNLVDAQSAGPACTVISRTPYRGQTEEPFERVTVKVRLRCELEYLTPVLHGLETESPRLFLSDFVVSSRRQFAQRGRNQAQQGVIDISFDVYGYLRKALEKGKA
nr:type II secretion system protein GspM [Pseudomarimonas arenosa]